MSSQNKPFLVLIDGRDALEWKPPAQPHTKGKPHRAPPRVSYTRAFEEIEAYTAMGLTAAEYHRLPGTPEWADEDSGGLSKCDVVTWFNYHSALAKLSQGIV